ncbi:hemolysin family protein [Lentisphaera profundi]|uniref:Hemolysin family protein n=1 Tax=Lentisphaera profundi TaxID=1658616 RepID=A0ABY7W0W8_9BACT|nr:hemolysin family protein [Lentisphaera profundi]WDE99070.1 hemolysin family protein [Lentisphaera profundi]
MLSLVLLSLLVVCLSALSSMSEAAFLSVSDVEVEKSQIDTLNKKAASALKSLHENLTHTISVLVILNNIANIAGSLVIGAVAADVLDDVWQGFFSATLVLVIIIWAEIIPKTIGERYDIKVCLVIARPLYLTSKLLGWLAHILNFVAKFFVPAHELSNTTDEAEILMLAKIGGAEGVIDEDESEMIANVFKLDDTKASDIMTPRVKMFYYSIHQTLKEIKESLISCTYTRIVLVGEGPDDIKGVAHKNELLIAIINAQENQTLENYIHKVRFVPEQAPADKLLKDFQDNRRHLAVVVDEFGGVEGVVTLEDVLEVLTGEIVDEYDSVVDLQQSARLDNISK